MTSKSRKTRSDSMEGGCNPFKQFKMWSSAAKNRAPAKKDVATFLVSDSCPCEVKPRKRSSVSITQAQVFNNDSGSSGGNASKHPSMSNADRTQTFDLRGEEPIAGPRNKAGYLIEIPQPVDNPYYRDVVQYRATVIHDRTTNQRDWLRAEILKLRLLKSVGLREWEWSLGEPFDEHHIETSCVSPTGLFYAHIPSRQRDNYAILRRRFRYTRGEDPICRGRLYVLGRARRPKHIADPHNEHANEMSSADKDYTPDRFDIFNGQVACGFRTIVNIPEDRYPMPMTAGECLMGC